MRPRRPGRRDSSFDTGGAPCPRCATPLEGKIRGLKSDFAFVLLPPRLTCDGCSAVWEVSDADAKGAVKIGNSFWVPVETGRNN